MSEQVVKTRRSKKKKAPTHSGSAEDEESRNAIQSKIDLEGLASDLVNLGVFDSASVCPEPSNIFPQIEQNDELVIDHFHMPSSSTMHLSGLSKTRSESMDSAQDNSGGGQSTNSNSPLSFEDEQNNQPSTPSVDYVKSYEFTNSSLNVSNGGNSDNTEVIEGFSKLKKCNTMKTDSIPDTSKCIVDSPISEIVSPVSITGQSSRPNNKLRIGPNQSPQNTKWKKPSPSEKKWRSNERMNVEVVPKKLNMQESRTPKRRSDSENTPFQNDKNKDGNSPNTPNSQNNRRNCKRNPSNEPSSPRLKFPDYLSDSVIETLISSGLVIEGTLRVSVTNKAFFASNLPSDLFVCDLIDRNGALDSDDVYGIVKVKPVSEKDKDLQLTVAIVGIKSQNHNRICIGHLKPYCKAGAKHTFLKPLDTRLPKIKIPSVFFPKDYEKFPSSFSDQLFSTKIAVWEDAQRAVGIGLDYLGTEGEARTENKAIILKYDLDVTPYPSSYYSDFPSLPYTIPPNEFDKRKDLRDKCIFTIDPPDAKDLDDAVSFEVLEDGSLLVGVHIADVTHFLEEGSPLDTAVGERATSIYLVDAVHHMLPFNLCQLCSLNPGEDRLTFSVVWRMKDDGTVLEHYYYKSVIRSCAKLHYQQVQEIIDGSDPELSSIHNKFSKNDIINAVSALHKLAQLRKAARVEGGSLRIDNVKLKFKLNPKTRLPDEFSTETRSSANELIEEFMLLANITVATTLQEKCPDIAFLRCHDEPPEEYLKRLMNKLEKFGVIMDPSSSSTLQSSMDRLTTSTSRECLAQIMVVNNDLVRAMTRALYYCSSKRKTDEERRHYALSIPLYTHFTSPIRRYADVIVHRQLAQVLNLGKKTSCTPKQIDQIAKNCNKKKYSAKLAGDDSIELHFALYVGQLGSFETEAVVCYVSIYNIECLIMETGFKVKIFFDKMDLKVRQADENLDKVAITWPDGREEVIDVFSIIKVELTRKAGIKLDARLLPHDNE